MAFNTANTQAAAQNNTSWRADGFINVSVPRKDGTAKRLGSLALRIGDDQEMKQLVGWLEDDPSRISKLLEKAIIDFRSAKPAHQGGLDLE